MFVRCACETSLAISFELHHILSPCFGVILLRRTPDYDGKCLIRQTKKTYNVFTFRLFFCFFL